MTATDGCRLIGALLAWSALWCGQALSPGQALAQSQLPAQAQTPGQAPSSPAQAATPANPPDAPVPPPPVFPPPSLRSESKMTVQPSPSGAVLPGTDLPVVLLRSTLTAFNDANLTNNYSVLLGLAAPSFQQENNASRLAESFAGFREHKIDISAIVVLEPRLVKPAGIDGQGLLRVTGYFPSRPLQLWFNIAYQSVEGRWRFAALAVDARPAEAQAEPAAPVMSAPRPAKAASTARRAKPHKRTAWKSHPGRRGEPPLTTNYR